MGHLVIDPYSMHGRDAGGYAGTRLRGAKSRERAQALRLLANGVQVVYALRLPDGTIKIGCSSQLQHRRRRVHGSAEVLGFMPGDFADEQAIHRSLREHLARAREYYHPSPPVLAVVNGMRDRFNLPHIAA